MHPTDYVVLTYATGSRKVDHMNSLEYARLYAVRNAPGYVYRADQVVDPDRGYLCKSDRMPVFHTVRSR